MRSRGSTGGVELDAVLSELLSSVRAVLGQRFVGMYLHGSLACGDFDRHSDVDFVVAIDGEVEDGQLAALQAMHARLYALESRWAQHLEGAYITTSALRRVDHDTPEHLFLDHGSKELVRSDHDTSVLQRHVLREHGIMLAGPPPASLIDPVTPERLRAEMRALLDSWLSGYLDDPAPLQNGWLQPYVVLTLCRLLYTLHHAAVASKRAAAEWAMSTLDGEWTGLIIRAWAARPDPALKARQRAVPHDVEATLAFIRYARALVASGGPGPLPVVQRSTKRRLPTYELGTPTS